MQYNSLTENQNKQSNSYGLQKQAVHMNLWPVHVNPQLLVSRQEENIRLFGKGFALLQHYSHIMF
jgi:hypothetical protein